MGKTTTAPAITEESLVQKRLRRINELLGVSLDNPDPLQATLGAACSDLLELGLRFQQAISEALADSDDLLSSMEGISRMVEMRLKVDRQVDRFVQLDGRLTAARRTDGAARPK